MEATFSMLWEARFHANFHTIDLVNQFVRLFFLANANQSNFNTLTNI